MTETAHGNPRILPFDFPGAPESAPWPYTDAENQCMTSIPVDEVPGGIEVCTTASNRWGTGFYCTRYKHGEAEPHCCYLRVHLVGTPVALIVWGGE